MEFKAFARCTLNRSSSTAGKLRWWTGVLDAAALGSATNGERVYSRYRRCSEEGSAGSAVVSGARFVQPVNMSMTVEEERRVLNVKGISVKVGLE